jgi:hypothetical protein
MLASSVLALCRPRFQAGSLLMEPRVHDLVEEQKLDLISYLARHLRGDWGDVSDARRRANIAALRHQRALSSSYELIPGENLTIITDAKRRFTTATLTTAESPKLTGVRQ